MKVRIHTLWRMPVYCMAASYISALVTVYLGGYFFLPEHPALTESRYPLTRCGL